MDTNAFCCKIFQKQMIIFGSYFVTADLGKKMQKFQKYFCSFFLPDFCQLLPISSSKWIEIFLLPIYFLLPISSSKWIEMFSVFCCKIFQKQMIIFGSYFVIADLGKKCKNCKNIFAHFFYLILVSCYQ